MMATAIAAMAFTATVVEAKPNAPCGGALGSKNCNSGKGEVCNRATNTCQLAVCSWLDDDTSCIKFNATSYCNAARNGQCVPRTALEGAKCTKDTAAIRYDNPCANGFVCDVNQGKCISTGTFIQNNRGVFIGILVGVVAVIACACCCVCFVCKKGTGALGKFGLGAGAAAVGVAGAGAAAAVVGSHKLKHKKKKKKGKHGSSHSSISINSYVMAPGSPSYPPPQDVQYPEAPAQAYSMSDFYRAEPQLDASYEPYGQLAQQFSYGQQAYQDPPTQYPQYSGPQYEPQGDQEFASNTNTTPPQDQQNEYLSTVAAEAKPNAPCGGANGASACDQQLHIKIEIEIDTAAAVKVSAPITSASASKKAKPLKTPNESKLRRVARVAFNKVAGIVTRADGIDQGDASTGATAARIVLETASRDLAKTLTALAVPDLVKTVDNVRAAARGDGSADPKVLGSAVAKALGEINKAAVRNNIYNLVKMSIKGAASLADAVVQMWIRVAEHCLRSNSDFSTLNAISLALEFIDADKEFTITPHERRALKRILALNNVCGKTKGIKMLMENKMVAAASAQFTPRMVPLVAPALATLYAAEVSTVKGSYAMNVAKAVEFFDRFEMPLIAPAPDAVFAAVAALI
ncbi:hypothetical protein H9P43_005525 [Blastocladiella emersonii ATCC 22665]|nr:hypothetical protein H9P43_005525 [Blastocladiella emersonii ATCC 22665]